MAHHIIFEGAELAGKSWLMSRVYDYLEPKYNQNKVVLDGCHWFNCDVGVYGTKFGKPITKNYLNIFQTLKNKNLLIEKFHISDIIYNRLHNKKEVDYRETEKKLKKLNFKIILVLFPENKQILEKRIKDRLSLYPHYERILQNPNWYLNQQKEYINEITKTVLPCFVICADQLPDENLVSKILCWLNEK